MKVIPYVHGESEDVIQLVIKVLNGWYGWLPSIGIFESRALFRPDRQGERRHITTLAIQPEEMHASVSFRNDEKGVRRPALDFYQQVKWTPKTNGIELKEAWLFDTEYDPASGNIWLAHEMAQHVAYFFFYERGYFDEQFVAEWDEKHSLSEIVPSNVLGTYMTARQYWEYRLNPPVEDDDVSAESNSGSEQEAGAQPTNP